METPDAEILATAVICTTAAATTVVRCAFVTVNVNLIGPIPTFCVYVWAGSETWGILEVSTVLEVVSDTFTELSGETTEVVEVDNNDGVVAIGLIIIVEVVEVVVEVVNIGSVVEGSKEVEENTVEGDGVSVVVVLCTVEVTGFVVDVVVGGSGCVVVVLDNSGKVDVCRNVVVVCSLVGGTVFIVVVVCHVSTVVDATGELLVSIV